MEQDLQNDSQGNSLQMMTLVYALNVEKEII